jgi:hypothetical protein
MCGQRRSQHELLGIERPERNAGPDRYPTIPKACPHAVIGTHPSIRISQSEYGFLRPKTWRATISARYDVPAVSKKQHREGTIKSQSHWTGTKPTHSVLWKPVGQFRSAGGLVLLSGRSLGPQKTCRSLISKRQAR